MEFLVVNSVVNRIPKVKLELPKNIIPEDVLLADSDFAYPNQVDIIIGVEYFYSIILNRKIELIPGQLFLRESKLGWLAYGSVSQSHEKKEVQCFLSQNVELCKQIKRFWEIESFGEDDPYTEEETFYEKTFVDTTIRDESGRFIVHLPKRKNLMNLLDNKVIATKRHF
jgi:hypothetical protein